MAARLFAAKFEENPVGSRSRAILSALPLAHLGAVIAAPATTLAAPPAASPPTISIAFGSATLGIGNSTSLTFTIANPNANTALTGIADSDPLPSGLIVASPNGLTGSCGGGTITAAEYSSTVSLSGATLAASTGCVFAVDVSAISPGTQTDTTGAITSNEGGAGGTATASVTVGWAPTISMAFSPASIAESGTSTLTFTLYNPETNSIDLAGLAFTDTLPAGLTVADSSTSVCDDGTTTGTFATSGGNTITLSGAPLPVSWVCQFSVTVTGPAAAGTYHDSTSALTSTNGIPGAAATTSLVVLAPNTTAPPTSTFAGSVPGRSAPSLPILLLVASFGGFLAVVHSGIARRRPGR
jgi:hypothetical protein